MLMKFQTMPMTLIMMKTQIFGEDPSLEDVLALDEIPNDEGLKC